MAEELKKPVTGGSNDVEENKVIALLSYIIFFVPFLAILGPKRGQVLKR